MFGIKGIWSKAILLLLLFFSLSIGAFAQEMDEAMSKVARSLIEGIKKANLKRVAVSDILDYRKRVTALGQLLSDDLVTKLFLEMSKSSGDGNKVEIIERSRLSAILSELKLTPIMLQEQKDIKRLGKVAGVDGLIVGSVAEVGEYITVNLRVITTSTGRIVSVGQVRITSNNSLREQLTTILKSGSNPGGGGKTSGVMVSENSGEGIKTTFFITRPLIATLNGDNLIFSVEAKAYKKDYTLYIAFLDDKTGIVTSGGATCRVKKLTPFLVYQSYVAGSPEMVMEKTTKIDANTITTVTVHAKCEGDVGDKIISSDIGLIVAYLKCPNNKKNNKKCIFKETKGVMSVKNILIRSTKE